MIVIDIWGGKDSQYHVARYLRTIDEALAITKMELERGFLVNLRLELVWGPFGEFDERKNESN